MFPGTLIFDPVLKICNWPDSTTCISELLGPTKRVKLPGFVAANQDLSSKVQSVPSPTTELPVIETSTPAIKLSKRILSLFQNKNRKPSRYRTGLPGRRRDSESEASSRTRLSAFKSKNTFRDNSRDVTTTRSPSTTTSKATTPSLTTTQSVRIVPRIRPIKLSAKKRFSPLRGNVEEDDKAEEEDMEVSVRKESSVTSITSSVRVSVREETSLVTGVELSIPTSVSYYNFLR